MNKTECLYKIFHTLRCAAPWLLKAVKHWLCAATSYFLLQPLSPHLPLSPSPPHLNSRNRQKRASKMEGHTNKANLQLGVYLQTQHNMFISNKFYEWNKGMKILFMGHLSTFITYVWALIIFLQNTMLHKISWIGGWKLFFWKNLKKCLLRLNFFIHSLPH